MKIESFDQVNLNHRLQMPMIVVYERPTDYPNSYIARLFDLAQPTEVYMQADTLAEIRAGLPLHMVMIERQPQDDPHILEIWV
jgi:hypothetical protein